MCVSGATGAFSILLQHLYKEVTGRSLKLTMYGKPYPVTYRFAEGVLEEQAKETAAQVQLHKPQVVPPPPRNAITVLRLCGANVMHWLFPSSGSDAVLHSLCAASQHTPCMTLPAALLEFQLVFCVTACVDASNCNAVPKSCGAPPLGYDVVPALF